MGYEKVRRNVLSQEQEMQTCEKIGKNYMIWQKRGILVEIQHVKAHRTKKKTEKMTQFERFRHRR